ncbi:hypothetical protein [Allochromatium palmeri]|uniref:Uncharacterized protein n=1 Tax=Allochromatium palmeri TaxID=231048 RepID=A0A6N8EIU2_9GAMM|nr:hypothetical protein [Allochromatium palmeri]MTW22626.1 hypothetical protein [Allochromatium palmeri]
MAHAAVSTSGGGKRFHYNRGRPTGKKRHPKIKLWDKKPLTGVYLGTVEIFDKFEDEYRTGIEVRKSTGDIVRLYPNGNLMDKVKLAGVKPGDQVHIEVTAKIPTSNNHLFDDYSVHVI